MLITMFLLGEQVRVAGAPDELDAQGALGLAAVDVLAGEVKEDAAVEALLVDCGQRGSGEVERSA